MSRHDEPNDSFYDLPPDARAHELTGGRAFQYLRGGRAMAAMAEPRRDEAALLPSVLTPSVAKLLSLFLVSLFAAGVCVAVFVPFAETVSCNFVLVPQQGANPVTSSRRGIIAQVAVRDGSQVKKGDPLFVIRSDELRVMAAERDSLERETASNKERLREMNNEARARKLSDEAMRAEYQARVNRLLGEREKFLVQDGAVAGRHAIARQAAASRRDSVKAQTEIESRRVDIATALHKRVEEAHKKGVTPEWEMLREQYSYEEARLAWSQANVRLAEADSEVSRTDASNKLELNERALSLARLDGEIAETKASLERQVRAAEAQELVAQDYARQLSAQLARAEIQLKSLNQELEGTQESQFTLTAPFDGAVIRLGPQREGAVIERGQVLCELAQAGAKLQTEVVIPEKDAGRLEKGQRVRLLFSAYPYTRYGIKDATLTWVSPAARDGVFRGRAELFDSTIVIEGTRKDLYAGMGGEARIDTGRRTLLQFAFEPLRQLRENVR